MRLTRLELKGFKSFRDKTVLEFPDKYMGVVGPNGSGKSNITEAICFVLGKSRGLRAANLQELIFNGGVGGQPASKAVVALTLTDADGARHKISRIVDTQGNSIYKLNDKKTTRQRIIELVGDSEYNIILQDDITKVVEMKPRDRRKIIDDLCGIGEYDDKKEKALRELEKVEERISQTHIILGEKRGYLNELRKERDEAMRYVNVRDELRSCRATLLNKEIQSMERRSEKIDEESENIKKGKEDSLAKIAEAKEGVRENNSRMKEINSDILKLEEEKRGTKITEVRGEILRYEDRSSMLEDQLTVLEREESEHKGRLDSLNAEEREARTRLGEYGVREKTLEKQVESEAEKAVDPALETEFDQVKNTIYETRSNVKALREVNGRREQELKELENERGGLEGRIKDLVTEEQNKIREVERLRKEYDKSLQDFKKFEDNYSSANAAAEIQERLEEQRILLSRRQSELETMMRASGGLHQAVKAVMGLKKVIPGIHGPVFQLGEVSDKRYNLPLQVAAGGRMQYVVVSKVDDAAKCMDYLRKKKIGRCTFLPLDKLKPRTSGKLPKQAIGFARDFIGSSGKFSKVFEYVFGDTILVKDIKTAKEIGVGSWRMVTLDGDLLETSGAMTGGHMPEKYEITFSNVDEVEAEIKVLESSVESLKRKYEERLGERKKLDSTLMTLRERLRKSKEELDNLNFEKNLVTERRTSLRDLLNKVVDEISGVEEEVQKNKVEATKLEKALNAGEKKLKNLAEKRGGKEATKLDGLKDELRDLEVEKTKLEEKLAFTSQQGKEIRSRLDDISTQKQKLQVEVKALAGKVRELESGLENMEKARDTVGGEIENLVAEREKIEQEIERLSATIGEVEHGMEGVTEKLNEYVIEKTKIVTRLEDLYREYGKYEGVELLDKSVNDLTDLAEKLEGMLTEFGSVNMRSIETYDVIKKEYDDIMEKLETLKSERQSIFDFMDKIESKKRVTFMEAFDKVKESFERIFAELSDGKGTLILDNPMNISESGLNINASPGGKKLMSLDAMSGGEKVLTSSAFLLALQQYKPSYFYIVDELDAALDKRNSVRLAEMLANSTSQFLMVTHNNQMLKYMDSAIGVSMVQGVSQIVGVRFNGEEAG